MNMAVLSWHLQRKEASVKNMLDSIFFTQQFVQEHHKLPGCDSRNRIHDFLLRDSFAKRMLRNGDLYDVRV